MSDLKKVNTDMRDYPSGLRDYEVCSYTSTGEDKRDKEIIEQIQKEALDQGEPPPIPPKAPGIVPRVPPGAKVVNLLPAISKNKQLHDFLSGLNSPIAKQRAINAQNIEAMRQINNSGSPLADAMSRFGVIPITEVVSGTDNGSVSQSSGEKIIPSISSTPPLLSAPSDLEDPRELLSRMVDDPGDPGSVIITSAVGDIPYYPSGYEIKNDFVLLIFEKSRDMVFTPKKRARLLGTFFTEDKVRVLGLYYGGIKCSIPGGNGQVMIIFQRTSDDLVHKLDSIEDQMSEALAEEGFSFDAGENDE